MSTEAAERRTLFRDIRQGLAWSFANNLVLRMASLVLGIVLAHLLVPADFGVYAIGLTVQSILLMLTDLGLSAYLIRFDEPDRRGPTVATLSLCSGAVLALAMSACADPIARALNEPSASGVIAVLSITLPISAAGVVPFAKLQRDFQQRKLFACTAVDFAAYTTVTVTLVLLGLGPISLALGRVTGQALDTSLQFILARVRPRFGYSRAIMRSALAYGLPLAGANVLSWALLNIDNVVVARVAGAAPLGLYVLAFNISNWPMNAIGQAVRSVSLAGFSKTADADGEQSLKTALGLTWAAALPVGVLLAALSYPLVILLYGHRWSASATVLAALGIFGALRVAFDLMATYLMAKGAPRPVLYVQLLWFVALIPPMILATHAFGIKGAGWSHLVVGAAVILPAYALALSRVGVRVRTLVSAMWLPIAACVPAWLIATLVSDQLHEPVLRVLAGGTAGLGVYVALTFWWVRRLLPSRAARATGRPEEPMSSAKADAGEKPVTQEPMAEPVLGGVA